MIGLPLESIGTSMILVADIPMKRGGDADGEIDIVEGARNNKIMSDLCSNPSIGFAFHLQGTAVEPRDDLIWAMRVRAFRPLDDIFTTRGRC